MSKLPDLSNAVAKLVSITILLRNWFKFTDAVVYISIEELFCQSLILDHSKLRTKALLVNFLKWHT